jgi:CRP/FNR family cyclic AMP-dependent transcriptional regulator
MRPTEIADLIADQPFFTGLDRSWQDLIAGCGTLRRFRAGELVLRAGDPAEEFFVVRSGSVALELAAPGRGVVTIETLGPGDLVGASWLFPPYVWSLDARARSDVATIGFDATCLRGKCDEDTALGYTLMGRFAGMFRDRLQASRLQLLDLYGDDDA